MMVVTVLFIRVRVCSNLHAAEDVMMETVVEVSTECAPVEEDPFPIPSECEPAAKKRRGGESLASSSCPVSFH